jgi:hypothetical protein
MRGLDPRIHLLCKNYLTKADGLPAQVVCARSWHDRPVSGFVVRKEKKDHGTERKIDGNFRPGTNVVLFDDVTTKGGSMMQAVRERGARVKDGHHSPAGRHRRKPRERGESHSLLYTTRDLLGWRPEPGRVNIRYSMNR